MELDELLGMGFSKGLARRALRETVIYYVLFTEFINIFCLGV